MLVFIIYFKFSTLSLLAFYLLFICYRCIYLTVTLGDKLINSERYFLETRDNPTVETKINYFLHIEIIFLHNGLVYDSWNIYL